MPMPVAYKNTLLGNLPSTLYASLHNVDDATTGGEITGTGGGNSIRQPVTLAAASAGARALSGTAPLATFDIAAGQTVRSVGYWTLQSGGVLIWYYNVTDEIFANAGKADLNSGSIGLSDTGT